MTLFSGLLTQNSDDSGLFLQKKLGYGSLVMLFATAIILWAFFLRDTERLLQSDNVGAAIPAQNSHYSVALADVPKFLTHEQIVMPIWLIGLMIGISAIGVVWALKHHQKLRHRIERANSECQYARRTAQILQQRMEEKIRTRTAELEISYRVRDNLSQQVKSATEALAAQEKMAALGRVVAGIAHEINTPIGVAVTASSLLAQILPEYKSENKAEIAQISDQNLRPASLLSTDKNILTRPQQLISIIEQALANAAHKIKSFKQVSADQHLSSPRRLEIHHCLQDCVNSLQALVIRQGHQLIYEPHSSNMAASAESAKNNSVLNSGAMSQNRRDIWLTIRPDALWQVLSNLITNALSHGFGDSPAPSPNLQEKLTIQPKKAGIITLTTQITSMTDKNTQTALPYFAIDLADNGQGMKEEIRRQIFEPFFTTKRGQGGTGLGLSICHNLVTTALRGKIECESRENQGTKFRIYLPMTPE